MAMEILCGSKAMVIKLGNLKDYW
ncbi:hypothetical protein L195_g064621, partial [Trifolium pratense]